MKQSIYLAVRYLLFHRVRTAILVVSIGLIIYLPAGLNRLVRESEQQLMSRAETTPLVIGARGNQTDLVINTLYFEQNKIDLLELRVVDELSKAGLGTAIPILSVFNARDFPIIGTNLDYFHFRELRIREGRTLRYVGECVLGESVARQLGLAPGDRLISSPENFMDLAGTYPLEMEVVGILESTNTPDDLAVFTDLKTNWIIMGYGHGHEDMAGVKDPTLVLDRDSTHVTASPKLFLYNRINGKDPGSFHFHGNLADYPVGAVLFVPENQKASTLLRGRFETGELANRVVVPTEVVGHLLQHIFRISQVFRTVFLLVGLATLLILGLIVALSLRLRKDELYTMFIIGSSRNKTLEIIGLELLMLLFLSLFFAGILFGLTGYFVEDFIQQFIL